MTALMTETQGLFREVFHTRNEATLLVDGTSRAGIEAVLGMAGFDDAVRAADLVVTGEGAVDAQTAQDDAVAALTQPGEHSARARLTAATTAAVREELEVTLPLRELVTPSDDLPLLVER